MKTNYSNQTVQFNQFNQSIQANKKGENGTKQKLRNKTLGSLFVAFALTLLVFTAPMNASASEKGSIVKVLKLFSEGADKQNAMQVGKTLSEKSLQFYQMGGSLHATDKQTYLSLLTAKKIGGSKRSFILETLDIEGEIASAKVVLQNDSYRFDNYFNLINISGKWKIVSITLAMNKK